MYIDVIQMCSQPKGLVCSNSSMQRIYGGDWRQEAEVESLENHGLLVW